MDRIDEFSKRMLPEALSLGHSDIQRKLEKRILKMFQEGTLPIKEMLSIYRCAMMAIETKMRVLDEQFSLSQDRNPIESISSRIKSIDAIYDKARRIKIPLTLESITNNIFDIAGVRVVCAFEKDIYMLRDCLLAQNDVTLFREKDYIKNPKESGYRSLHLIVEVPVFLAEEKKQIKVEIQLRTMAMDQWASLEHRLLYKKDLPEDKAKSIRERLLKCASLNKELDEIMQSVKDDTDSFLENGK